MRGILLAQLINKTLGGPFVAPWEVDDLTPDILEPILALATQLPTMQTGLQTIEARKQAIRAEHARKVH